MSKGVIIRSGVEAMTSSIRTFAITLTKDMAPRAVIIVYDLTADDKLLADSLEFPVDGIAMNKVSSYVVINRINRCYNNIEVASIIAGISIG